MSVNISGVLKDGTGKPVQNCTVCFKAKRTSSTVVLNTLASDIPDDAGRYSIDMEPGEYDVMLSVEGRPPSHAGKIAVYDDSKPGTLNDFLGAMFEDDLRPEVLRRFEAMVAEVDRQAAGAAENRNQAAQFAGEAAKSAQAGAASEKQSAKNEKAGAASAAAAAESARQAAGSRTAAAASAKAAAGSEAGVAENARKAAESASQASASADRSEKSQQAAERAAGAAADSEKAAGESRAASATSQKAATDAAATATASAEAAKQSAQSAATQAADAVKSASAATASATEAQKSAQVATAAQKVVQDAATEAKDSAGKAAASEAGVAASVKAATDAASKAGQSASLAEGSRAMAQQSAQQSSLYANSARQSATAASTAAATAAKNAAQLAAGEAADRFTDAVRDDVKRAETASADAVTAATDAEKYRDEALALAKDLNVLDATTTRKGVVQLSNATGSSSEVQAATPKAVRDVMVLASGSLQKSLNGNDIPNKNLFISNIGAARAFSPNVDIGRDNGNWTTAEFIDWLTAQGAFNQTYWVCRGSVSFGLNKTITDTGCGDIGLTGAVVEVMGLAAAMTIRVTTATRTNGQGGTSSQFTYINNGAFDLPGWRRDYNTRHVPGTDDIGAVSKKGDTMSGTLITTDPEGFRMKGRNQSVVFLFDGTYFFLRVTKRGDPDGAVNNLYPFYFNTQTGEVIMGNQVTVNDQLVVKDKITVGLSSYLADGDINGGAWGGLLSDYIDKQSRQLTNTGDTGVNGWMKDAATGLIRQWGLTQASGGTLSVAFPVTFPNAALNVHATPYTKFAYVTPNCAVVVYTKWGATLQIDQNYPLLWEATGY